MPNSSPPYLEDSLWVENPLAGMLMNFQSDGELEQLLGNLERLAAEPPRKSKLAAGNAAAKEVLDDIVRLCYRDAHEQAQPKRLAALDL